MFTFPLPLGWGPQIVVFKKIFENKLLVAPQRVPIVDVFFEALETYEANRSLRTRDIVLLIIVVR